MTVLAQLKLDNRGISGKLDKSQHCPETCQKESLPNPRIRSLEVVKLTVFSPRFLLTEYSCFNSLACRSVSSIREAFAFCLESTSQDGGLKVISASQEKTRVHAAPGCSLPSLKDSNFPVNTSQNLFTVVSILSSFSASCKFSYAVQ